MKAGSNTFNNIETQVCKKVTRLCHKKMAKPYHRFAYRCLANNKMYKYAKRGRALRSKFGPLWSQKPKIAFHRFSPGWFIRRMVQV